jgi:hypothetical protein
VGKMFDYLMGPLNGPDIALFKKFSNSWTNINQEAFENGLIELISITKIKFDKEWNGKMYI